MTTRLLLCTDLYRTLLPNGPHPESPGVWVHFAAIASRPEVRNAAREQAARLGHADAIYIARGALPGMDCNYSAGVLEGLLHFYPQTAAWFEQEEVLRNA